MKHILTMISKWIYGHLFPKDIRDNDIYLFIIHVYMNWIELNWVYIFGKCKSHWMISVCVSCLCVKDCVLRVMTLRRSVILHSNSPHTVSLAKSPLFQFLASTLWRLVSFSFGFFLWSVHVYYRPRFVISQWLKCRLKRWVKLSRGTVNI